MCYLPAQVKPAVGLLKMSTFITYEGDNLAIMRELPSETIDLIYIDPPYFSQRNYGDFDDRWKSMHHYLDFMVERLKEMHRLLKPTGSIYVHLDWHAVHYVKVEMDKIFGYDNFVNEVVWNYSRWTGATKSFQNMHNTILFYKKDTIVFNVQFEPYSKNSKHKAKRFSIVQEGVFLQSYTSDISRMKAMSDVWNLSYINSQAKERNGYPTQKPAELMERIILASSNEGDLVADFFCGSGSFIKKAHELGRSCIGVDVSPKALFLARSPTKRPADGGNAAPEFSNFD